MIRTINENEFKIKLENTYPYYLYCIRWPSQPLHVKVGYGNKYRPCSSSYSTPFGSDGKIKIWLPEQDIDKTSMYTIEQQLHSFLLEEKRCIRGNKSGREVYKIELDTICSYIDEFITRTQSRNSYNTFQTTISNYKKNFKPKAEDYTVFAYNLLSNVNNIKCVFCNRCCSSQIYECLCLCNNEKTEIYVGSTCFKKLNRTYLKESTVTSSNYKLNKIINPQFENELDEQKPILVITDIDKDDVVDCYIQRVETNGRKEKSYIEKKYMTHIESYLMNNICHYIFNNGVNKTFKKIIDNKFITDYKLTGILNIITIYGLLSNSKYIILGKLNTIHNSFEIEFNHPTLNSTCITSYFYEYRNTYIFNYTESSTVNLSELTTNTNMINRERLLTDEQVSSMESTLPYISGFPGTGKSRICKHIIENNRDKNILIITPTYSTRQSLVGEFESKFTNILPVVIASIYDKKLIIDKFKPDIILVDEYGMIDIIGWYKIMNICDTFNRPSLKVFGDPYQLPSIDFQAESHSIIKQMYMISNKLTINFRSTDCPEQYNYLIENKVKLNIFDIKNKFEVVSYNKETILSLDDYNILAGTKKTVNKINQIFYNNRKIDCIYCPSSTIENQIHLTNKEDITYVFCDRCIHNYEFIFTSNINCIRYKLNNEVELPSRFIIPNDDRDPRYIYRYKIFKKENRFEPYCYYSKNREKIFYNGERVNIALGQDLNDKKYYVVSTIGQPNKKVVVFDIESLFKKCINLPYAQTVHKSQGQTLTKVAIIMDKNNIMSSLLYTAFTRAKQLRTIKIIFKNDIQVSITKNTFDDIYNDLIKCEICNSNCILNTTSSEATHPKRKYWGCSSGRCGGSVVQWFDNETKDDDLPFEKLEVDFHIEKQVEHLFIRLKEDKDPNMYKSFFRNIIKIQETYIGSKQWIISLKSSDKIQKLIEHSIQFGSDNQYEN
jgi:hypothetical protein